MSLFSFNLFTGATLLLLAARVLGVGMGPQLSWLTILTPIVVGEILAFGLARLHVRAERQQEALMEKKRAEHLQRLQQQLTSALSDHKPE